MTRVQARPRWTWCGYLETGVGLDCPQHKLQGRGEPVNGDSRTRYLADLRQFLRTIQKPGVVVEDLGVDDPLVASGLLASLAIMQIVVYLEETYSIHFSAS